MQAYGESVQAILKLMKSTYQGDICKSYRYRTTGIPHKEGCSIRGACRDWEKRMENELADTIYKDLPDSMRVSNGKGRVRGSRGGKNEQRT